MHCVQEIKNGIYWVGCNDFGTQMFERVLPIPEGVSYITYFIDDEKTCLLDSMDKSCRDEFLENVEYLLHGRKLDYFVIQHMEPDHASSALALIEKYPDVKIIGQAQTFQLFEQFYRHPMPDNYIPIKDGDQLKLGKHVLQFIKAPMVHWPEVFMSYDLTDKFLFTADAFGMFGTVGNIFADQVDFDEYYLDPARRYYVNIVGKYGVQVMNVLKKAAALQIDCLCPIHGLVFRTPETIKYIIDKYLHWAQYQPEKKGVLIAFASIYGNTARAVNVLAQKLSERGVRNIHLYDVSKTHPSFISAKAWEYSHLVLAAPTYNLNLYLPMENLLHDMSTLLFQNRKIAVLGCHSWRSVAHKEMMNYVENVFKNCELFPTTIDMRSSLQDNEECVIESMADEISEDYKAYPDPDTLV
ncbi:FprA family A-type flavoprotein [Megasphaera vaginalis (ex Bordigoni et al. 2020)]|uniref:FprA family A-type flavoprotein n=1 Tax=Megasphaera vaginalis (ex Bordigoni et al. 2020) TaxID=2045301 RepID=UPI000C79A83A|nr:FprA family A-type flavoprotein [Megasphaera vaginalis (ex Bordigoni et al. 2020)]